MARIVWKTDDPKALEEQIRELALEPPIQWYGSLDPGVRQTAEDLLPGSIDFHVHAYPSPALRHGDAFWAAEEASRAGMRAIVLKDHHSDMSEAAWLARENADLTPPFEVFGSVWLNNHVGGWNPYAVDKAIVFGARLIGAPTVAAYGQLVTWRDEGGGVHPVDVLVKTPRPPKKPSVVYTLDNDGKCRPEVLECLDIIKEAGDVVLGGGHLDKHEIDVLIRTARDRGLERFCLTHAPHTGATPQELRDLCADTGAVCEFLWKQVMDYGDQAAEALRTIGLEHITFSTDAGFYLTPTPVEHYLHGIAALLEAGLTEDEVAQIVHRTPAQLLSI